MKWIVATLCIVAAFASGATVAQAQLAQPCPGPVAHIISPVPGATLPAGAVTFTWCNAGGDYFLDIESVPGAHDIFFAFPVGVESVTLGPACALAPPSGCIPSNGETIFVTLWTNIVASGRKNYVAAPTATYMAANSNPTPTPAVTATAVDNQSATASATAQTVTLTATVTGGTVNQGTVNFQVLDGAINVGAAVTSATLTTGSASVSYLLPGGTTPKDYTIQAAYSGGASFQASSGTGTLTVNPAPPAPAPTTTTVHPQTVTLSSAGQTVTLTATVADGASTVNEGTVTFQVMDGAANVGTAVASAPLTNGLASAIYALPAGLAVADYTIQAAYSGGSNFEPSSGSGILTVSAAPPPIQTTTATTVSDSATTFSGDIQHVTLTAAVSVPGGIVNQGTVTFQVMDGATSIGTAVPSAPLTNGLASVSYALPAGLAAQDYTIEATYSGGTDFLPGSGMGTLTVNPAPAAPAPTTTAVDPQTVTLSSADQTVTLTATVADGASTVNEGTVTFQVMDGAANVGTAVASAPLTNGLASVIYGLPAGLPANGYTIQATYSGGTDFLASSGTGTLTVGKAARVHHLEREADDEKDRD